MKPIPRRKEIRIALAVAFCAVVAGFWIEKPDRFVGPPVETSFVVGDELVTTDGAVVTEFGGGGLLLGLPSAVFEIRERHIIQVPLEYTDESRNSFSYDPIRPLLNTSQTPVDTSWNLNPMGMTIQLITFLCVFALARYVMNQLSMEPDPTRARILAAIHSKSDRSGD